MKGTAISALTIACLVLLPAGCANHYCEMIDDACDIDEDYLDDDFVDRCVEDYKEDRACRKAIRDWAKCADDKSCDDRCSQEFAKVKNECGTWWRDVYY